MTLSPLTVESYFLERAGIHVLGGIGAERRGEADA